MSIIKYFKRKPKAVIRGHKLNAKQLRKYNKTLKEQNELDFKGINNEDQALAEAVGHPIHGRDGRIYQPVFRIKKGTRFIPYKGDNK